MTPAIINSILHKWTGHDDLASIETIALEACVNENAFNPSLQF